MFFQFSEDGMETILIVYVDEIILNRDNIFKIETKEKA